MVRHSMHTYGTGGYFHCANCECGLAQPLGPNNETCRTWDETELLPEDGLRMLSELGVQIGWMWAKDSGIIR